MNQRTLVGRLLSPAGFGLVLIFFLLPFATVSCGTATDKIESTFTGIDMVVGTAPDITGPGMDEGAEKELGAIITDEVDLEPLALLAAIAVLAGMAVSLVPRLRTRYGLSAGLALLGLALVVAAVARVPGRVADVQATIGEGQVSEPLTASVQVRYGFWLALVALGVLVVGNVVALVRTRTPAGQATQKDRAAQKDETPPGDETPLRLDDYLSN